MRVPTNGRWRVHVQALILGAAVASMGAPALAAQVTYHTFAVTDQHAVSAQPTRGTTAVSLTVRDSSIGYVIKELARQADLHVAYYTNDPRYAKRISLHLVKVNVMDAFRAALQGTNLDAKLTPDGGTVVISETATEGAHEATGSIAGHVTDSASDRGLGGATVKIQGSKLSAVTNEEGNFTIRGVPAGDALLNVRLFGFRPAARAVTVRENEQTTVRIVMHPVATVLSGVVTTATGTQRKIEVGNDITTINVDSVMQVAPISSVTDLLENRVPGLTVLHSSGIPGDPARIRIRSARSINGNNDPIVIVDGVRVYASQSDARNSSLAPSRLGGSASSSEGNVRVAYATPSPLDQIDPSSIQTIEVFKGPSASAMYGSDAANGVIVITTKHGDAGPTHWNLNLGAGLSYQPSAWPVNYYRFGYGLSSTTVGTPFCAWNDLDCTVDSVVAYQALNDPRYNPFADHGNDQSGALTVSGGSSTLRYSLTASGASNLGIFQMPGIEQQRFIQQYGYAMPKWMVRPNRYNTLGGSGQMTVTPSTKATVTLVSSLFNSTQGRSSLEQAPQQLEGRYINPLILGAGALISREYERATSNNLSFTNALTANWSPLAWLPLYATAGLNTIQRVDKTYIPYGIYVLQGSSTTNYDSTGFYGLGRGTSFDKTLTMGTNIPMRGISLGIGGNYHAGTTNDFHAYTNALTPGLSDPSTFPIDSSQTLLVGQNVGQSSTDAATYGWYLEPRLNFASKFFVSPGFRLDGGSATGANAGLTGFPKIDLSYVMIDRQDDPLWGVVNLFRPRLALGVAGTQPPASAKLRLYSGSQGGSASASTLANLNGSLVPVAYLSAFGNTTLQPERSREIEGGFETDLWNNRFNLAYTRYGKVRHNAILAIPVAASVDGGANYNVNIGEIRGTGTELTVNANLLQSQMIGWHVGLNFSHSNEVLVKLRPGQHAITTSSASGTSTRLVEGYPLWGRWAYPIVSYVDVNGDGILQQQEIRFGDSLVYLGRQEPKSQLSMNTDVTLFRGMLGVHGTVSYKGGFTQFDQATIGSGALAQLGNTPGLPLVTQAAIVAATPSTQQQSAIGLVQTVSTLRFDNLSVNYQVPRMLSRYLRVPRMQVALQGNNLGLHTNYRGVDPSVNAFSTVSGGEQLVDSGQLPEQRTWSLHVILGN